MAKKKTPSPEKLAEKAHMTIGSESLARLGSLSVLSLKGCSDNRRVE